MLTFIFSKKYSLFFAFLINVSSNIAFSTNIYDQSNEVRVVKVGCLFPLAGPGGLYGRDSVEAIKIAEEDIQEVLLASGIKLEVMIGDTRSKSLRGVQLARSFVDDEEVDFLCGVVSSRIALAVSQLAKEKKVFFIGTDHASPRLVNEALHPYYFRVSNDTRQSMQAGAKYIRAHYNNGKPLRISFIGPDYDYGYQAWSDLRGLLKSEGVNFEVVGEFWPKLFEKDYNIYIHALSDGQPDIVINGQWGQDFIAFIRQAKQLNFFEKTVLMNFDAGGNYETFATLGDDMPLGLVLSARHHVNWPDTENNKLFVKKFKDRVGRYPSYAAEGAYSGIIAIAKAVQLAGGVDDPKKIQKNLENLIVKLPEDPEGFTSYMNPKNHQMLQAQAIGKTVSNNNYLPATIMLGDWFVHFPDPMLKNGRLK
ncbi:MAG: ABC transporter substrate-binding protein [Cellvibrionaceae bacterium]